MIAFSSRRMPVIMMAKITPAFTSTRMKEAFRFTSRFYFQNWGTSRVARLWGNWGNETIQTMFCRNSIPIGSSQLTALPIGKQPVLPPMAWVAVWLSGRLLWPNDGNNSPINWYHGWNQRLEWRYLDEDFTQSVKRNQIKKMFLFSSLDRASKRGDLWC